MNESELEVPLDGGSHSQAVRVGQTVRRVRHPWSSSVFELLQHVERKGFRGAPRALGFDQRGREILTYVDGSAGVNLPDADAGPVQGVDHWLWRDDVLVHLGVLVRDITMLRRRSRGLAANGSWRSGNRLRRSATTTWRHRTWPFGPGFPWR